MVLLLSVFDAFRDGEPERHSCPCKTVQLAFSTEDEFRSQGVSRR